MSDYETKIFDSLTNKHTSGNFLGPENSETNDAKPCFGRSTIQMFYIKVHSLASLRNPS